MTLIAHRVQECARGWLEIGSGCALVRRQHGRYRACDARREHRRQCPAGGDSGFGGAAPGQERVAAAAGDDAEVVIYMC